MKVSIRNDAPTIKVRNTDTPSVRSANFSGVLSQMVSGRDFAGKGYLIGMLALTYSKIQNAGGSPAIFKSDDIPRVRINNTD